MTREEYLDLLVPLVKRLVGAVHDEGPDATLAMLSVIRRLPAPDDIDRDRALIVTLAAMVPPDQPDSELLGWTANYKPTPPPAVEPEVNAWAIDAAIAGDLPACALARSELIAVVAELMACGMRRDAIAAHLDMEPEPVTRLMNTIYGRKKAAA